MSDQLDIVKKIPTSINTMGVDECLDNLWMEIGKPIHVDKDTIVHDIRTLKYTNQLLSAEWADYNKIPENIVKLCRDPEYLHFVCKYILNIDLFPYQCAMLSMMWEKPLLLMVASRGASKSFMLSVYIFIRCLLDQGIKIVVVGAALRQSMVLFNYIEDIWDKAPILQDICGIKNRPKKDLHQGYWWCGDSSVKFLPMGTGEKIRGQRAGIIISDEFSSIQSEIFEVVVRGFAAVRAQGMMGNVSTAYKELLFGDIEVTLDEENAKASMMDDNQIIMAGTAYYRFNHFYKYYAYYKAIISSGGDLKILQRDFPDMPIPENIDASKYGLIHLPYDVLPLGMMDKTIMSQGKATMDPQIYNMEYGAIFPNDSEGFYLASWINNCTCPIKSDKVGEVNFAPKLKGDTSKKYIMGIDPASEDDNFAISIIEKNSGYNGLVYNWTTTRKKFEEMKRLNQLNEDIHDYNTFIIKHIRHLAKRFDLDLIVIDNGGGGISVKEGLRDPDKLLDDEDVLYYDLNDEDSQGLQGRHILLGIDFQKTDWRVNSHYGLREDLLNMILLFPHYDASIIEVESYGDTTSGKIFDTLEDNYLEIEQCKQETTLIQHSQTDNGTEKWSVPQIIGMNAEQVRKTLKRDRFTSLLLANWGCRYLVKELNYPQNHTDEQFGGVAKSWKPAPSSNTRFVGKGANKMKNLPSFELGTLDHVESQDGSGRRIHY